MQPHDSQEVTMKLARLLTPLGLALAGAILPAASAYAAPRSADDHGSRVVGHVYVNDNTAGENTIAAFDRHADGSLTATPGSPFPAGGAGTGSGIGSQGALQESADGRYLLAVDAGSGQISVLRIASDGKLSPVGGSPVASGGAEPVSIAVHDELVYAANGGAGANNYTGFELDHDGHLHALAGSTVVLPEGSEPGDVLFNRPGGNLVGVRIKTSLIDSFAVKGGRLKPAPGSPFPAQGPGPFGSEFRPTNPAQLFVSNAHGGKEAGTVSAFSVTDAGALSSIGTSPFADHQTAPCWIEISHDGRFLFTVNTASGNISRYAIASAGSLALLGSTPLAGAGTAPLDARLDPDGDTLWVVEGGTHAVAGLAVEGGNLTELSTSPTPLPAHAAPFGIVVT
jgi:6-phosphogluconolactonase (cycloisomerase 2 family)